MNQQGARAKQPQAAHMGHSGLAEVRPQWQWLLFATLMGGLAAALMAIVLVATRPAAGGSEYWLLEILRNCGLFFAPTELGVMVVGLAYVLLLNLGSWLPSRRTTPNGFGVMLSHLATCLRPATETSAGEADPARPQAPAESEDQRVAQALFNEAPAGPAPDGDGHPPGSEGRSGSAAPTGPVVEKSASRAQRPPRPALADVDPALQALASPWLRRRCRAVFSVLFAQGPEAARAENQAAGEQDEAVVASGLVPAMVCEWVLPLLGFLGTVWGLHEAIGPLKDGVELMMKSLAAPGATSLAMREEAMVHFGAGFAGLKTAFDTTLLGLVGLVLIGLALFFTRKRAADGLAEVCERTEEALRCLSTGQESLSSALQDILHAVDLGLLAGTAESQQPRLATLQDAVVRGLLCPGPEQKDAQPVLGVIRREVGQALTSVAEAVTGAVRDSARHVRDELARDVGYLGAVGGEILREERFQSAVHARAIAPDVRRLRKQSCPDVQNDYVIDPLVRVVHELPKDHSIDALAVANGAVRVAVASTHRTAKQRYVSQVAVEWLPDNYRLARLPTFEEHAPDPVVADTVQRQTVDADVRGLTYAPDGATLFVLGRDGTVRSFGASDGMKDCGQAPIGLLACPFVWTPLSSERPFTAWWESQQDGYGLALVCVGDTSERVTFDRPMCTFLRELSQNPNDVKLQPQISTQGRLLCIAGPRAVAVAEFAPGRSTRRVARAEARGLLSATALSESGRFVLLGQTDGLAAQWCFDQDSEPAPLAHLSASGPVSGLYLGPEPSAGHRSVAVLRGYEIAVYRLQSDEPPRLFNCHGTRVTHVAQSLDRRYLAVANDLNEVMLFSFGLEL